MRRSMIVAVLLLAACGGSDTEERADAPEEMSTDRSAPAESDGRTSAGSSAKLAATPATLQFDPCGLFTDAELRTLHIPDDVNVHRSGNRRELPRARGGDSPRPAVRPFIACNWKAEDLVPTLGVRVYDTGGDFGIPAGEERVEIGDGAWGTNDDETLFILSGDRLVELSMQIPEFYSTRFPEDFRPLATMVLAKLGNPPAGRRTDVDMSALGGPAVRLCDAIDDLPAAELFKGPDVWEFPDVRIAEGTSYGGAPDKSHVGCSWADGQKGGVTLMAHYLDQPGIDRWEYFIPEGQAPEAITVGGRDARYLPNQLLIDMGEGRALAVELGGVTANGSEGRRPALMRAAERMVAAIG
ncbi:MAG: hypothetical protein ACR2GQ_07370 [Gemmatimonadota bacterium]